MRLAESAILVRIQPLFGLSAPVASPLESEKPTASPQRSPETRSLDLEIHRRCFSAVLFDLILDLLPLIERAQSSALDSRDVDKHIPAALLRLNESIAFGGIEPFYRTARHSRSPSCRSTILSCSRAANGFPSSCANQFNLRNARPSALHWRSASAAPAPVVI